MQTPTRLPDNVSIPAKLVQEWVNLSDGQELDISLTRSTIDHLFFTLDKLIRSQGVLQQCLIKYSNEELDAANELMTESQTLMVEGQNRLRQFMTDVMLAATRR